MFLTAQELSMRYDIDPLIAKFYVDREPPANNLYWHEKELYMRSQPGYLFLPMIADLYARLGADKSFLLSEPYLRLLENIGHESALEELGKASQEETINACRSLLEPDMIIHPALSAQIADYLNGADNFIAQRSTGIRSLHRGDVFLFSLCVMPVPESELNSFFSTWFALITTLLLMDDAADVIQDRESGDLNAFLETNAEANGFSKLKALFESNLRQIGDINPGMATGLRKTFESAPQTYIQQLINA